MGGRFQNSRPRLRESSSPHHLTRPGLNNAPQRSPRGQLFQNRLECSEPTPGARGTWGPRVYLPTGKVPGDAVSPPLDVSSTKGKLLARRHSTQLISGRLYFPVSGRPPRSVRSCSVALTRFLLPLVLHFSAKLCVLPLQFH